jgi:metal-responsive CopG/Arc/MetJ family transcriptional regulator
MATTARTVTISLPPELARKIDRAAKKEGRTRSELMREAARQYLERRERWEGLLAYGQQIGGGLRYTEDDVARIVKEERAKGRRRAG